LTPFLKINKKEISEIKILDTLTPLSKEDIKHSFYKIRKLFLHNNLQIKIYLPLTKKKIKPILSIPLTSHNLNKIIHKFKTPISFRMKKKKITKIKIKTKTKIQFLQKKCNIIINLILSKIKKY
jgi:hypothetical protein